METPVDQAAAGRNAGRGVMHRVRQGLARSLLPGSSQLPRPSGHRPPRLPPALAVGSIGGRCKRKSAGCVHCGRRQEDAGAVTTSPIEKELAMGKGNHSQKNDKKNKKPKQDKTKTVVKK